MLALNVSKAAITHVGAWFGKQKIEAAHTKRAIEEARPQWKAERDIKVRTADIACNLYLKTYFSAEEKRLDAMQAKLQEMEAKLKNP